jgi:hypothetical protein
MENNRNNVQESAAEIRRITHDLETAATTGDHDTVGQLMSILISHTAMIAVWTAEDFYRVELTDHPDRGGG